MNLSGAVGIITGASSGIGWATARLLSEAGAKLVVSARRAEQLAQLVDGLACDAEVGGGHRGSDIAPDAHRYRNRSIRQARFRFQ